MAAEELEEGQGYKFDPDKRNHGRNGVSLDQDNMIRPGKKSSTQEVDYEAEMNAQGEYSFVHGSRGYHTQPDQDTKRVHFVPDKKMPVQRVGTATSRGHEETRVYRAHRLRQVRQGYTKMDLVHRLKTAYKTSGAGEHKPSVVLKHESLRHSQLQGLERGLPILVVD